MSDEELKQMITRLRQHEQTKQMKLFLRSIHYNGLGYRYTHCPPNDWRNPFVIDGYNTIIERACQEMNVTFLDTRFISSPLWDSAPDWSHLLHPINVAELNYMAAMTLNVRP